MTLRISVICSRVILYALKLLKETRHEKDPPLGNKRMVILFGVRSTISMARFREIEEIPAASRDLNSL